MFYLKKGSTSVRKFENYCVREIVYETPSMLLCELEIRKLYLKFTVWNSFDIFIIVFGRIEN